MNYIINFSPTLPFLILLIYNIKKIGRVIAMSNFIIALYTFSMFSFGISCINESTYYLNLESFLIVFISVLILTRPLTSFEIKLHKNITIAQIEPDKMRLISMVVIFFGFVSIIFFSLNINKILNSDFTTIRNQIMDGGNLYQSSIYSKIAILGAYLSPISLFLYFYAVSINQFKTTSRLLLFSSLSFILYTLNVAGRDGIIIWSFSFIALICLFYPLLSKEILAKLRKTIIIAICIALPYFSLITIGRFAENNSMDKATFFSVFDYIGQQPYQLTDLTEKLKYEPYKGEPRMIYPLFVDLTNFIMGTSDSSQNLGRFEIRAISMEYDLQTWCFAYYMGSIITDVGIFGLFIFSLLMYLIFSVNLKIVDNSFSISNLLIAFSWYMIIIVGVFFFYYGQTVGNLYLLLPFLINFLIKLNLR